MDRTVWTGCFERGWGKFLSPPDAYGHPAKVARGLAERIYAHLLARGYVKPGDVVLDPFAGIGGFAPHAMLAGLRFVGVELEPKFWGIANGWECPGTEAKKLEWPMCCRCQKAKRIIEYGRPGILPHHVEGTLEFWANRWGLEGAMILLGDSWQLREVVGPVLAECVVSSPPYEDQVIKRRKAGRHEHGKQGTMSDGSHSCDAYGHSPGQLGAMPAGEPPVVEDISPALRQQWAITGKRESRRFGCSRCGCTGVQEAGSYNTQTGDYDSPAGVCEDCCGEGYLGVMPVVETFWSAAAEIMHECHAILKPGGHAVWVVKAFVRNKALVDFPGQWRALCEKCGFEFVEEIHASLVKEHKHPGLFDKEVVKKKERKSFFRRNNEIKTAARTWWDSGALTAEKQKASIDRAHNVLWATWYLRFLTWTDSRSEKPPKGPTDAKILQRAQVDAYKAAKMPPVEVETRIDHEVVLILRKPEGAKVEESLQVDCVAGSPPFQEFTHSDKNFQAPHDSTALMLKGDGYGTTPGQLGAMPPGTPPEKIDWSHDPAWSEFVDEPGED